MFYCLKCRMNFMTWLICTNSYNVNRTKSMIIRKSHSPNPTPKPNTDDANANPTKMYKIKQLQIAERLLWNFLYFLSTNRLKEQLSFITLSSKGDM